jgi:archaemetzincin
MKKLELLPLGASAAQLTSGLKSGLERRFRTSCVLAPAAAEPAYAFDPVRQQYHSTEILRHLAARPRESERVLAVCTGDLFIPILTFVFGEAELGGRCAVISSHRLQQELYGLPADPALTAERLLKEAVHELGHTLHLTHCEHYECAMAPSHSVEWIDLKTDLFCEICVRKVRRGELVAAY